MKRTNLVLDVDLLQKATRVLQTKTYSDAVNQSLAQAIKLAEMRGILSLAGSGAWQGNLDTMRERTRRTKKKRKWFLLIARS